MKVCLPDKFDVVYPQKNKAYYAKVNSKVLRKILSLASDSYCMYCGTSLIIDGKESFHLEHSVDKEGNYNQPEKNTMLRNCKFNFAAACAKCNLVYKKRIEKIDFSKYMCADKCPKECNEICDTYQEMREDYCKFNSIILQPIGYKKDNIQYKIRYNLLRHVYEADLDDMNSEAMFFIEHHILRFHLNGENFSNSIINICVEINDLFEKGMTDIRNLLEYEVQKRHENVIGKGFVRFLESRFMEKKAEELIEFCELLVVLGAVV